MVKLAAHTNAVGYHVLSDWRTEESHGVWYDVDTGHLEPYDVINTTYSIPVAESSKPAPFQGDHKTAYDYWRGVKKVVEDSPYLLRSYYYNPVDGVTSSYDYVTNEYISKRHNPFVYNPWNVYQADNAWSESVTKALNSISGKSAEVGANLGELKQVVDMLSTDVFKGVAFIRHMRHGRWRQAADVLGISRTAFNQNRGKDLANYWLEYSYGWRPLAASLYDIQATIAEAINRQSNLVEGTGSASISGDVDFPYNNWRVTGTWKSSVKTILRATFDSPTLALINDMGLTNPASIAWELVPFSFVVDWFVPVGNVLSALTAGMGLNWHGGQITVHDSYEVVITHNTGTITPWVECVNGGRYREQGVEFRRVALTGFPYPRFYADITPYSTPRAVNALALVRQLT